MPAHLENSRWYLDGLVSVVASEVFQKYLGSIRSFDHLEIADKRVLAVVQDDIWHFDNHVVVSCLAVSHHVQAIFWIGSFCGLGERFDTTNHDIALRSAVLKGLHIIPFRCEFQG